MKMNDIEGFKLVKSMIEDYESLKHKCKSDIKPGQFLRVMLSLVVQDYFEYTVSAKDAIEDINEVIKRTYEGWLKDNEK